MTLSHFSMIRSDFLNKDPDIFPEQAPLIILDRKSAMCMANNGKVTKKTRHIYRRMHFVRNGEEENIHNKVWYEGGLKLSYIGTKNVSEDELNPRLVYAMVRLDNR